MRTAIVSDLHLGAGHGADLARAPFFRDRLLEGLVAAKPDQVVLLGDIVEMRDSSLGAALEAAGPFFDRLGEAIAGARVAIVPGNHDHHLIEGWLEERRLRGRGPLGLAQTAPARSGPAGTLARRLRAAGAAEVALHYPGLWVSGEDGGIYATHGHYLDSHVTVPTFERLGVGLVHRLLGGLPGGEHSPDDYERMQAPLYAFLYALAQAGAAEGPLGRNASARVWHAVTGRGGAIARARGLLLGSVAMPGAVLAARRLGLGRFRSNLSLEEIARAGLLAMGEVVERLGIEADHVLFGHTHRRGPLQGEGPWRAGAVRLHNTGSWVWSPMLLGEDETESPFWPGTIAVLEDGGAPALRHLLADLNRGEVSARLAENLGSG